MTPSPDPATQEELRELLAQTIDRMEQDGDAAVEAACRAHPRLADALRRRIATLRGIGVLEAPAEARPPERLGEFRLIRQLGAGGMGVVYLAEQERLGREVALKVVRPEHLFFAGARERFLREIEVVARLQHPGIVPVHTVGEDNGVPYFVMDLVRGRTLAEALQAASDKDLGVLQGADLAQDRDNPGYLYGGTWEAACLRVVRQVADALAHAHERGVTHRDVKPSNIMLTADGSGRAMLFDFGLAAVAGSGRLTRTGAQLGTLRYMAPEQTRGEADRIGPRTDVYGLGVTLYEMLTLTHAFDGKSDPEVILAVQRGAPRPVRDLNLRISWEAETVCATAMDVDPARRYRNAADFARDLLNILEQRPIEARRAGLFLRARRYLERHPARATAAALTALIVVGGPTAYAWQEHRAGVAITAQRDRAERNYRRAIAAVDRLLSRVGAVDLRLMPQMEAVRKAVLEDAIAVLGQFIADDAGDPHALREIAAAHMRLGTLYNDLGRSHEAAAEQARGVESLTAALAASEATTADREQLARLRVDLARSLGMAGRSDEARAEHVRAAELLDALLRERPGHASLEELTSSNDRALGILLGSLGDGAGARATLQKAAERIFQTWQAAPGNEALLSEAVKCCGEYGLLLLKRLKGPEGDDTPVQSALERTTELGRRLVELRPTEPGYRYSLATAQLNYAGLWSRAGDFERARALYAESKDTLEKLVRQFPDTLLYQLELATVHNQIGLSFDLEKRVADAEPGYRRTVEILREIHQRVPDEPMYARRLAVALMNHSVVAKTRQDFAAAETELLEAAEFARKAVALAPAAADARQELVNILSAIAFVRRLAGDHVRAVAASEEIVKVANTWSGFRAAAYGYCEAGLMARKDQELEPAQRDERFAAYRARALELVREGIGRATATDKPNPRELREGRSFAPLRGLPEFETLCQGLR